MMDLDFIKKLNAMREEEIKKFHQNESNNAAVKEGEYDDEPYEGTTYLYIRAFDGDNGSRPIPSGQCYCLSPDIELYLNGVVVDTGIPLLPDTNYTVQVTVTNDGDLICNLCTVDLYLCQLSLGFNSKGGQLIGIANTRIDAHSKTTVEFPFTTTKDMEGHRCMFARAYSMVSHDYPSDLINFDTYRDRHIGQQNLNIVRQGDSFKFEVNQALKEKARDIRIVLQPEPDAFNNNRYLKQKYSLSRQVVKTDRVKLYSEKEQILKPDIIKGRTKTGELPRFGTKLNSRISGLSEKITGTKSEYVQVTKQVKQDHWLHRIEPGKNKMKIEIPTLGLKNNEAITMKLSAIDSETGKSIGEITVIIVA